MQSNPSETHPEPPPRPGLRPRATLVTVLAVVAVVAISAFALGWTIAPRLAPGNSAGPGGLPWTPTTSGGPYYGFPVAFSDPQCVINCNVFVRRVGNTSYVTFNISRLDFPVVAFQIRITNLGVNTSAPFQFTIYGAEVAGIIYDTSPLNTTWIRQSGVPPLAAMPAAGNSTIVTLAITPQTGSSFAAVAGEFFWVVLARLSSPGGEWVTAGVPIVVNF